MSRPPLFILAGGKGTRLHSVTKDLIPKCMVNVKKNTPFLYLLVQNYMDQGFTNITICVNHLKKHIIEYPWPKNIKFQEDDYFGINGYFEGSWVVNGDTWIDCEIPEIIPGQSTVLVNNNKDAGAQYFGYSVYYRYRPVKVVSIPMFIDIGTPKGLQRFKDYIK